jgi:hypothetical protein
MTQMSLSKVAIAASTFTFATLLSFGLCEQRGVSLSVESAQARVGRPLTPVSVAGVARRQNRRAAYGYGAGAVGAGVAGAAAVGAATGGPYYTSTGYYGGGPYSNSGWNNNYGPNYNHGGGPNNRGGLVGGDDSGTSARYARVPNYGGGPYNANAFGGPVGWWGGVNGNDHAQYMKNLHDSGYDPKNNFNANGTIKNQ